MAVDQAADGRRAPSGRSGSGGRPEAELLVSRGARKGGEEGRRSRCAVKADCRQTCHEERPVEGFRHHATDHAWPDRHFVLRATVFPTARSARLPQLPGNMPSRKSRAVLRAGTPGMSCTIFSTILRDVVKRSEEHTSELQSLMRTSYAVFCLTKKKQTTSPSASLNSQTHIS